METNVDAFQNSHCRFNLARVNESSTQDHTLNVLGSRHIFRQEEKMLLNSTQKTLQALSDVKFNCLEIGSLDLQLV